MADIPLKNLWSRFKKGDDQALTLLFRKYADELYSYGLKISNNESLVKDCIQEVFIKLIDKRKVLLVTSYTHIYLFKSLRNKIFEELRSENRKQNLLQQYAENEDLCEMDIEQSLIQFEDRKFIKERLNQVISELTEHQREIIFLKYSQGFTNTEIAEVLQIDKASVRTLLYRSIKSIRNKISIEEVFPNYCGN